MSALPMGLLVLAAACLLAAGLSAWNTRRSIKRLDHDLDAALAGNFQEHSYDESTLSRLEQKLARFLSQSKLTSSAVETERRRVQALLGDISHQTKTPLANILLYVQLLDEEPLSETTRSLCDHIGAQAEKLQFLIEALVKTSRLESGAVQVHPAVHPLSTLLETLEAQHRPAAEKKGVALEVTPSALSASFDPRWTAEAVGNLVDNAIKYTPAEGGVTVVVDESPLFVKITVGDTGPGIAEAEHALVFERFYRGKNAAAEGVGVGLYLARQVVAAQGGYIRLRSEPGAGCAFSVFLPH